MKPHRPERRVIEPLPPHAKDQLICVILLGAIAVTVLGGLEALGEWAGITLFLIVWTLWPEMLATMRRR